MKFTTINPVSRSLLCISACSPQALFAAPSALSESPVDPTAFVRMFVGLIVVIALIFVVAWLSRKMKFMQNITTGYQIKNLASMALSNREKVALIEVGGKQILLGVAPGRVSQLHVFDEPIEVSSKDAAITDNTFSKHLKTALGISTVDGAKK